MGLDRDAVSIIRKARPGCTGNAGVKAGPGETVYAIETAADGMEKLGPG
jgi:hypothetical protein